MNTQKQSPAPARIYDYDHQAHGSAHWADAAHLQRRGYGPDGRLLLGYGPAEHRKASAFAISTATTRHGVIAGPTRSGKGVCSVIPHCLDHAGSLVVMDIKDGEVALITARHRQDGLNQSVQLFDPWDCAASHVGLSPARFNPLDGLDPKADSFVDNALLIGDALVMNENSREPFWGEEAKAMIAALCMHTKTLPKLLLPNPGLGRTLAQVRFMLSLGPKAFSGLVAGQFENDENDTPVLKTPGMAQSPHPAVRAAAGRIMNKSPRERSGVLSTAQSNTHFLDSPALQRALGDSDFDPADLQLGTTSLYIIMPTDKHHTHARVPRLLIALLLTAAARFTIKPNPPVLFILEEANALGALPQVTTAYSLLAGQGVQVISIWQDLNQMAQRYDSWQTMIANSGFVQCLATRDYFTAEYFSKLCGTTTIAQISEDSAMRRAGLFSDPAYLSRDDALQGRNLINPDEIMAMHPCAQLVLLAHAQPVCAYKTAYFLDRRYRDTSDKPRYDIHPHYADEPVRPAIDFTRRGLPVGAALETTFDGS